MISDSRLKELFALSQKDHPERLFVLNWIEDNDAIIYDLGCGRHKTIDRAIGVDVKPVTDIASSIESLPMIENGSADVVISRHSLEHLIDPVEAIREWGRILKKGGKMIIVLPDHEYIDTMDFRLSNGKHLHAYTRKSFLNMVIMFARFYEVNTSTIIPDWSFGIVLRKAY